MSAIPQIDLIIQSPRGSKKYTIGVDIWSAGEVRLNLSEFEIEGLLEHLKKISSSPEGTSAYICPFGDDYTSDVLVAMSIVVDMVETHANICPVVDLPYLPYSRQERQTYDAPYVGLRVIQKLFPNNKIVTDDIHAHTSVIKFENCLDCISINSTKLSGRLNLDSAIFVIAPDQGAYDRAEEYKKELRKKFRDVRGPFCLTKRREGGQVKSSFYEDSIRNIENHFSAALKEAKRRGMEIHFVVVDDIVDGGRTFLQAAEAIGEVIGLKEEYGLHLLITHGIFSSSSVKKQLDATYDNIIVYNPVTCIKRHD